MMKMILRRAASRLLRSSAARTTASFNTRTSLGGAMLGWDSVYGRSLRPEWAVHDGCAVIPAALDFHTIQDGVELVADCGEVAYLAHRAAVGVERDFVVWTE